MKHTNKMYHEDIFYTPPELMNDQEIVSYFQRIYEENRKNMRNTLWKEHGIVRFIEELSIEEDWRVIRGKLYLLEDYAWELAPNDRKYILDILREFMVHTNGAVRQISAHTAGHLLALAKDEKKDLWEDFLRKCLFPKNGLSEKQHISMGYSLKTVLETILYYLSSEEKKMFLQTYASYFKSTRWTMNACFNLLSGIQDIPYSQWSNMQRSNIFGFLRELLTREESDLRILSLTLIRNWLRQGWKLQDEKRYYLEGLSIKKASVSCEKYLIRSIWSLLHCQEKEVEKLSQIDETSLIQDNLRLDIPWMNKLVHFDMLFEKYQSSLQVDHASYFKYASHLINVLHLNTEPIVFFRAGEDLMKIMPFLDDVQQYEIIQESFKDIELSADSTNFLPSFLGKTLWFLNEEYRMEFLPYIKKLSNSTNSSIVKNVLEMVGILLRILARKDDKEYDGDLLEISDHFFAILCRGLAHYKEDIAKEALFQIGHTLYREECLAFFKKNQKLLKYTKKILCILAENPVIYEDIYNITSLKCIVDGLKIYGKSEEECSEGNLWKGKKIAFYTNSFNPFTRRDKAITKELVSMGYIVFICAHDFSWNKNIQSLLLRRKIIQMAIADQPSAYLFPLDMPISIDNTENLAMLKSIFDGGRVSIATTSESFSSRSAYWQEVEENSIHSFDHIIFASEGSMTHLDHDTLFKVIHGEITCLNLPYYYDKMTPDIVQKYIAEGRDITGLIDPMVENMIHDWNLYVDQPLYKKTAKTRAITFFKEEDQRFLMKEADDDHGENICGVVYYRHIRSNDIYDICENMKDSSLLRQKLAGKILLIERIEGNQNNEYDDRKIILNELLASAQEQEYTKAICFPKKEDVELLESFGFTEDVDIQGCYLVDFNQPLVVFFDLDSFLRDSYLGEQRIKHILRHCKERLGKVLPSLYPGKLILHFESEIINYKLIQMIEEVNQPIMDDSSQSEAYGPKICVPFGKIFKGLVIPNTITKELNTEKIYNTDLSHFDIYEFPEYPSIQSQIRTIKAFDRSVIMVDDLYHKGYRMNKLDELLKEEGVSVSNLVVAVISGRGYDLSKQKKKMVKAAYTVPNMCAWLLESDLYPFIGGDGIRNRMRGKDSHVIALPSINTILPYQMPSFLVGADADAIWEMSKICLENAREIYKVLEEVYQERNHRSLTLKRIGEVITEPRYPERMGYDMGAQDEKVSELLSYEIQRLYRLKKMEW